MGEVMLLLLLSACAPPPASEHPSSAVDDESLLAEALDAAWAQTGLPDEQRPEVERVRTIALPEWPQVIAACLQEAGFPGAAVADGGIVSGEVPEEQRRSFDLSEYICQAKYPVDARFRRPLSDDQLRKLYVYQTGEQTRCLEGLGFPIAEPPSEQEFVERYLTSDGWNPMSDVPAGRISEANAACPQVPDTLYD